MSGGTHRYHLTTSWTGNLGTGTSGYRAYSRNYEVFVAGKSEPLQGSSDAVFRGDPARYSPEELLLASLSACHMLWFLHLCADAGIIVVNYADAALGEMAENSDGSGQFVEVVLQPSVTIQDEGRLPELATLHDKAHEMCFIARSVNFPVRVQPAARAAS